MTQRSLVSLYCLFRTVSAVRFVNRSVFFVSCFYQSGGLKRSTYVDYIREAAGVWQVVLIFVSMAVGQVKPSTTTDELVIGFVIYIYAL